MLRRNQVATSVRYGQYTPAQSMDLMDVTISHQEADDGTSRHTSDDEQSLADKPVSARRRRHILASGTCAEPEELDVSPAQKRKFQCPSCKSVQKIFSTSNDLQRHLKAVHNLLQPGDHYWTCQVPECTVSSKVWHRFDNFRSHVARMHGSSYTEAAERMQHVYSECDLLDMALPAAEPQPNISRPLNDEVRPLAALRGQKSRSSSPSIHARGNITRTQDTAVSNRTSAAVAILDQEHHDSEEEDGMTDDATSRPNAVAGAYDVFFACPYAYFSSTTHNLGQTQQDRKHSACGNYKLKTIPALKQHLKRQHKKPEYYCAICYLTFATGEDRDRHMRARSCETRDSPFENRMTDETWTRVNQKKGRAQHDYEEWYRIFETICPNTPRPRSPYVESEALAWYSVMLEVFRISGPTADTLHKELLKSCDYSTPVPASTRAIIQGAFARHEEELRSSRTSFDVRPPEKIRRLEMNTTTSEKAADNAVIRTAQTDDNDDFTTASPFQNVLSDFGAQDEFRSGRFCDSIRGSSPSTIRRKYGEITQTSAAHQETRRPRFDFSISRQRTSISLPRCNDIERTLTRKYPTSPRTSQAVGVDTEMSSPKTIHRRYTAQQ